MLNIVKIDLQRDAESIISEVQHMIEELAERKDVTLRIGKILKDIKNYYDRFNSFGAYLNINGEDKLIGLLNVVESFGMYTNGKFGVITEIYVHPKHRKTGAGRKLLQAVIAYANEMEWSRIEVSAPLNPQGIRSVEFYEKMGFAHSGPKMNLKF